MTITESSRPWLDNFHSAIDARRFDVGTMPLVLTGRGHRGAARVSQLISALSAAGWEFEVTRNVSVGRSVSVTIEVSGVREDLEALSREIASQL